MANPNFKRGDQVLLTVPWQMLGTGKVPSFIDKDVHPMIVLKKTRQGKYRCVVPGKRQTVSIAKSMLAKYNED